jgi:tripartite-type tricarboxylate transporter receptor subunit TctC
MTHLARLAGAILLATSTLAAAQGWPTRPITMVIPYPPGGLIDLVGRALQPFLQTELGVSVVAENRSGAGGNVGAEVVARSTPDGHTLLVANPSFAISPKLLNNRPIEDVACFRLATRAGTPRETVLRLNTALNSATKSPKLRKIPESRGAEVHQGTPEDFTNFIKAETAKFAPVIKRTGVQVE